MMAYVRSHDSALEKTSLKLVSAWASANHLVLGQVKVADDSNEMMSIPQLLKAMVLKDNCLFNYQHINHPHSNLNSMSTPGIYLRR